jgi:transglutaminase-like putative cysteine protease
MTLAFFLRLALYTAALAVPYVHSAVAIDYDLFGLVLYFLLIPGQALLAFFYSPPKRNLKRALTAALLFQLLLTLPFAGFGQGALIYLGFGLWSYASTFMLFRYRWRTAAVPEILYLASIYLRLVNFTRGVPPGAPGMEGLPQILLFAGIAALLAHLLTIMFALRRPGEERRGRGEYLALAGIGLPLLVAALLLVPPDFVSHSVVFNQLFEPPEPEYRPLDDEAEGFPDGNLRGRSPLADERGRNGRPGLYGMPADQWGEGDRDGDQEGDGEGRAGRQYAVLIVSTPQDPTYLADAYFEDFDPESGFGLLPQNPLNEIVSRRLLETWRNPVIPSDRARLDTDIFVLSTLPQRVMAYLPVSAEPTVFDSAVYPFTYSYPHVAAVSVSDRHDWRNSREFTPRERRQLAQYLDLPLDRASEARFRSYLEPLIEAEMSPGERAIAILRGFGGHLYEIGFEEDVSVEAMEYFLFESRRGDCTEFSNTTAILGRMAGIPTRVVTGYLASSGLQTLSHLQGVMALRENIPALQEEPLEELYLVTTAHRHSWTQFYLPDYGWIDFETTSFAIPPPPGGDPNSQDVVIPLIEDRTVTGREFAVPWNLLAELFVTALGLSLAGLYSFRYGRELWLKSLIRRPGKRSLLAAEKLLLVRLANEGVRLKKRSETPKEYTAELPELERFADLYDQLRFRERLGTEERERLKDELLTEIRTVVAGRRRRGVSGALKRLLTLKGLGYR